jgi:hypothetical protein
MSELDNGFALYWRKPQPAEMRPYIEGEDMHDISISVIDKANGHPKKGDMIARNPANHGDQWLVSQMYYEINFLTPVGVGLKVGDHTIRSVT